MTNDETEPALTWSETMRGWNPPNCGRCGAGMELLQEAFNARDSILNFICRSITCGRRRRKQSERWFREDFKTGEIEEIKVEYATFDQKEEEN